MSKLNILVIEDIEINHLNVENILKNEYRLICTDQCKEAWRILTGEEHIDLILLDYEFCKSEENSLLRKCVSDSRFGNIPVIVGMSGANTQDVNRLYEEGAFDVIAKPYHPRILKKRISGAISQINVEKSDLRGILGVDTEKKDNLLDTLPFGIALFEVEKDFRCVYFNKACIKMLGHDEDAIHSEAHFNLLDWLSDSQYHNLLTELQNENSNHGDVLYCVTNYKGENSWVQFVFEKMKLDTPTYKFIIFDKTKEIEEKNELKKSIEDLRVSSECDSLTGIYHREGFNKKAREMLTGNPDKNYVMIVWNFDRFKVINEQYGMEIGDELLIRFADMLRSLIRFEGTYARIESDHFAACIKAEFLDVLYKKITGYMENGIQGELVSFPVTLHAGIYQIENIDMGIDLMCDRANLALYSVKNSVINRWGYYKSDMRSVLFNEQEVEREMIQALEQEQFYIMYQPIIDAKTQKMVSAEALVRWYHPQKGQIVPSIFIPVFEKNGFVCKLDFYVWEKVCQMLAKNEEQGIMNVPVSVNLSRINFYSNDICDRLVEIAKKYKVSHELLKIEITESAYTEDPEQLISIVKEFHERGFVVLMDDFGSGYSSLNMLKDVPVDILKVDMKFMYQLESSERGCNILYSVISMAHSMNMKTVAEGVESSSQYELLCELSCDQIQGYYFSKPLPEEDYLIKLEQEGVLDTNTDVIEKPTVLVVDDVQMMREVVKTALQDAYQFLEAKNGLEALEVLKKNYVRVQLVITDVCMPAMDGIALLEKINESPLFRKIPVLVVTSYDELGNIERALSHGAIEVISKPFEPNILKKRIENIMKFRGVENISSELLALKERTRITQFEDRLINSDVIGTILLEIDLESRNSDVIFMNDKFKELHGITSVSKEQRNCIYQIFANVVDLDENNYRLERLIEDKPTRKQISYQIQNKDGQIQNVIGNMSFTYSSEKIEVALVVSEVFYDSAYYNKSEFLINNLFKIVKNTEVAMFCYHFNNHILTSFDKTITGDIVKKEYPCNYDELMKIEACEGDTSRFYSMLHKLKMGEPVVSDVFLFDSFPGLQELNRNYTWNKVAMTAFYDDEGKPEYAIGTVENVNSAVEEGQQKNQEGQFKDIMKRDAFLFAQIDLITDQVMSLESEDLEISEKASKNNYSNFIDYFVENRVYEDEKKYTATMLSSKQLLKWYGEGEEQVNFELRVLESERVLKYEWYSCKVFFYLNDITGNVSVVWQMKNIHNEKMKMNKILRLAEHDSLTGLLNRNAFENSVEQTLEENVSSQRLSAFIMIDIDNFKLVNDTYGHEFGDSVLKTVASQLQGSFRKEDYIGRLGGDEFAVFMPRVANEEIAEKKVKVLARKINQSFKNCGKEIDVTCSIGISMAPHDGNDFKSLYENADQAQYYAKKNGKDQYKVFQNLLEEVKMDMRKKEND